MGQVQRGGRRCESPQSGAGNKWQSPQEAVSWAGGCGEGPPNSHHTICQGCPGGEKRMCAEGHSREETWLPAASSQGSWLCNRPRANPHECSPQAEPWGPPSTAPEATRCSADLSKEAGLQTKPQRLTERGEAAPPFLPPGRSPESRQQGFLWKLVSNPVELLFWAWAFSPTVAIWSPPCF